MKKSPSEKPIIHTFSLNSKCDNWRAAWTMAGFVAKVLPRDNLVGLVKGWKGFAENTLKRIKSRENAPSLDGYLRWIHTCIVAPNSQYVFMTQPDIFPGAIQDRSLVSEAIARYASQDKLVLLAGSDAVIGTKAAFLRMVDIMAGDGGVTAENATDAFIVRRVMEQFPEFVIDIPSCKDLGQDDWKTAPLIRTQEAKVVVAA